MSKEFDLGAVSAYAIAVEQGYTGTETEFATLLMSYISVANNAAKSASAAANSAEHVDGVLTEVQNLKADAAASQEQARRIAESVASLKQTGVDATLTTSGASADAKVTGDQIAEIKSVLADIQYVQIQITAFSVTPSTAEKGSTVSSARLQWEINKLPASSVLDGQSLQPSDTERLVQETITTNKTFTLVVVDERAATSTKSTTIAFVNGVYYGVATVPTEINSGFVLGLTKSLQSSRTKTFSVAVGANQYVWFAVPTSYGTPQFNVGGFDGGFIKVSDLDFTNASGYTEKYSVYRSDNANLGTQSIKVL